MKNNKKTLLLILLTITTLILLSTASATNDNTNTTTTSSIKEKTTTTEPIVKEKTKNTQTKEKTDKTQTKQITKTNKTQENTKKDPITIDGVTYTNIIENQEITEYTKIEGSFTYINNSTFNVDGSYGLDLLTTSIVNNSQINAYLWTGSGNILITNSILNNGFNNWDAKITIDDSVTLGENFYIDDSNFNPFGTIYSNNPELIQMLSELGIAYEHYIKDLPEISDFDGNAEITNENFTTDITILATGNITFTNCQINAKITNNGNLTLQNCTLSNNNLIDSLIENKGNLTIIGSIVENNTGDGFVIDSTGDLIIDNSVFTNNSRILVNATSINNNLIVNITNSNFTNTGTTLKKNQDNIATANILNNTFVEGSGIGSSFTNTIVKENEFNNSGISFINDDSIASNILSSNIFNQGSVTGTYLEAYNNSFKNGGLSGYTVRYNTNRNYLKAYNNTFKNARLTLYCASNPSSIGGVIDSSMIMNNSVHDNIFEGNISGTNDIIMLINSEYNDKTEIYNNTYIHTSIIDSLNVEISPKIYADDNITFDYQIANPRNYDADILEKITYDIYIDDMAIKTNTTDMNIQLTSSGEHTITITPSISATTFTKTIEVLPNSDIIITPENLNQYVNNRELTRVNEEDRVLFQGEFNNLGEIFIVTDNIVIDGRNAQFTNTSFTIEAQYIIIQNMNITNTNQNNPVIHNTKRNNYIQNNHIQLSNTEGQTTAIKNTAGNTEIRNNELYVDGPANSIDHNTGSIADTQAILLIGGNKNTIQNNTITVTTTQESEEFGTIEAITATQITNTILTENTIHASNAKFTYGINTLKDISDNTISKNNITVISYRYADGIQVGNNAENILIENNQINTYCHNTTPVDEEAISYGIVALNTAPGQTSKNINILNNNINIESTVGYGIEIYQTSNTEIKHNTILVNGSYSMGIGFAYSPSSKVVANYIRTIGDSTQQIKQVTEEIQPANIGIKVQEESTGIIIDDRWTYGGTVDKGNTIHTYDKAGNDYAVYIDSVGCRVNSNKVRSSNKENITIQNTTSYSSQNGNLADNIYVNIEMDVPETCIVNKTITIKITILDEYGDNLIIGHIESQGYWYDFIKDNITLTLNINNQIETITIEENTTTYYWTPTTTGKQEIKITLNEITVAYAQSENITESTDDGDITRTITHKGYWTYNATTTTKTIEINPKPVSQTNTTTENLTVGETTTITATFYTDDDQLAGDGKAIFRVNGKTLRYDDGTVIFADVINGRAELSNVNITNEWMKPGTTIQAVYMGDNNNEPIITTPTNVTVTKPEAIISLDVPREAIAGQEITLKANVTDGVNAINSGRVAFKLNGKTLKDPKTGKALYANVENGIATITYTIPEKTKAKEYVLTAVFTDSATRQESNSLFLIKSV